MTRVEILHYITSAGQDVFGQWMNRMEWREPRAWARIAIRVDRLANGNFGDCRPLKNGVWESSTGKILSKGVDQ
jgi:putative component of toxin-antitoxin plasmid stabilization module